MEKKNFLFTICGRAGSQGVKSKNVRSFCGVPLVFYSLSALDLFVRENRDDLGVVDIALSTDSEDLIGLVSKYESVSVDVIRRAPELCENDVAKKDVILDCLYQMEERRDCIYDVVVDLDITSPLRTKQDIVNLISRHFDTGADITFSVTGARRNPYFNQVIQSDHGYRLVCEASFTTRQQAPAIYDMNASLYAYNPIYIKAGGGFHGGYCEVIEMYDTAVLDIDSEDDFELMQVIAKHLFANNVLYSEVYDNIKSYRDCDMD